MLLSLAHYSLQYSICHSSGTHYIGCLDNISSSKPTRYDTNGHQNYNVITIYIAYFFPIASTAVDNRVPTGTSYEQPILEVTLRWMRGRVDVGCRRLLVHRDRRRQLANTSSAQWPTDVFWLASLLARSCAPTSSDRASVERCRSAPRRLPSGHFSTTFRRVRRRARRSAFARAACSSKNADPAPSRRASAFSMPTSRPRTPAPSSANCRRTQRCACARHLRGCVVGPKAVLGLFE